MGHVSCPMCARTASRRGLRGSRWRRARGGPCDAVAARVSSSLARAECGLCAERDFDRW